ncbi:putative ATP-dependent RNA helicase [Sinomonas cyclohexanicum]|uniref:ATP-dependent RNA helicase n=1 Tax=Sinomonas cyclohexanicum TaxID=322009 RepID=A0ABN6FL61_SINCY|nr:DEAD/DEAH box helicase [Corynebacterium cyclohexanicum]BCT77556.1 putative ATP-dependent RNA helicase [Corynebacterium cyclohexanicum]
MSETTFTSLGVPAALSRVLAEQGIETPFPIQTKTLPDTLGGRDVLGRGQTGSGKTIAFALPLVAGLAESGRAGAGSRRPGRPTGLVLAPTRELATQIDATVAPLAAAMGLNTTVIYGGVSQARQERALRAGVDIVIACPGRLEDLGRQGIVNLNDIAVTVLDEADHMADLGFLPVVKRILDQTPDGGQRLLFSATLDNGVDKIVKRYLHNPLTHSVDAPQAAVSTMEHHVLLTADATSKKNLIELLASGQGRRVLFMRTKHHAKRLAQQLTKAGIPAVDLHGNLSQNARDRNLADFASGEVRVLVATDVAARGVHVDDVELVVHVDPPAEHKAYLHRSGRTARAGSEGTVVTIVLPEQKQDVRKLLRDAGVKVEVTPVTTSSPQVTALVGERAAYVDPADRAAAVAAKMPQQGGGKSTGANAQRKRSRGRGTGQGAQDDVARRGGRGTGGPGHRNDVGAARNERAPRSDKGARTEQPKQRRQGSGPRSAGAIPTVWTSTTGGTSGGSYGSGSRGGAAGQGRGGSAGGQGGRGPRGPRRASSPASNNR